MSSGWTEYVQPGTIFEVNEGSFLRVYIGHPDIQMSPACIDPLEEHESERDTIQEIDSSSKTPTAPTSSLELPDQPDMFTYVNVNTAFGNLVLAQAEAILGTCSTHHDNRSRLSDPSGKNWRSTASWTHFLGWIYKP